MNKDASDGASDASLIDEIKLKLSSRVSINKKNFIDLHTRDLDLVSFKISATREERSNVGGVQSTFLLL